MKYIILTQYEDDKPVTQPAEDNFVGCTDGLPKYSPEDIAAYHKDFKHEFRLLDDDENVYLEGKCDDCGAYEADLAFAPLDDYGVEYGCVHMQYRDVGTEVWSYL